MTETPIAQVNELLRQISAQLEIQDDAYSPQAARELLVKLEKIIPGDRRLKLLKVRLDEHDLRLQERMIYEETEAELEKLWQEALERDSTTRIPSADINKFYYQKALDRAESVANTHPDIILLKELVAIAKQKREDFESRSRIVSTLLRTKGLKDAIQHIQALPPNQTVDIFDLDNHPLGKFMRDEALSRLEAMAADFASHKIQAYIVQAEAYLAEHDPGAAKGVLERALKLYSLSRSDEAELKRELNLYVEPALQARQKAESLIQRALHASDAEAAWRSWKEASQTDPNTPKLEVAKFEILKRLKAELLRRLDSIKPLIVSPVPEDWRRAEEIIAITIIAASESEVLSEILIQADKLNSQVQRNDIYRVIVNRKISRAQDVANRLNFLMAQKLLNEAEKIVRNEFGSWKDILAQIESLNQEFLHLREGLRDLSEARAYLEAGKPSEQTDKLLQKVLSLTYQTSPAAKLKTQAGLLLAGEKLRQGDYVGYQMRLEGLLQDNPMDKQVLLRWQWVKAKRDHEESEERREKDEKWRRENYQLWIEDLRLQAKLWLWGSIGTAIVLLALSIYIILVMLNKDDPLSSLTSLISLIPILATKLVYDQSTAAYKRAEKLIIEEMLAEDKRAKEVKHEELVTLQKLIFVETPSDEIEAHTEARY